MNLEKELQKRSEGKCELCSSEKNLAVANVDSNFKKSIDNSVYICSTCANQYKGIEEIEKTVQKSKNAKSST